MKQINQIIAMASTKVETYEQTQHNKVLQSDQNARYAFILTAEDRRYAFIHVQRKIELWIGKF
jgi:hypothetical protein